VQPSGTPYTAISISTVSVMILLSRFEYIYTAGNGCTTENAGATKMQSWKMREWVNRHQTAGLENAREVSK